MQLCFKDQIPMKLDDKYDQLQEQFSLVFDASTTISSSLQI